MATWSKGIVVTARPESARLPAVTAGSAVHVIRNQFVNSQSALVVAGERPPVVALQESCGKVRTSKSRNACHVSGIGTMVSVEAGAMLVVLLATT
jgi:hypothetical protein